MTWQKRVREKVVRIMYKHCEFMAFLLALQYIYVVTFKNKFRLMTSYQMWVHNFEILPHFHLQTPL